MLKERVSATGEGLPERPAVSQEDWDEMHDAMTLALDALGDGPQDVNQAYLWNCIIHLRMALKTAHRRTQRAG